MKNKLIKLPKVRIIFPSLFSTEMFKGIDTGKYKATFLISKSETELVETLKQEIKNVLKISNVNVKSDKMCFLDGDKMEDSEGEPIKIYKNQYVLRSSNSTRPHVIHDFKHGKAPLSESDNVIYEGCYVNAIVDFWVQNNDFGKRVNSNLLGVQFAEDGEPLAMATSIDLAEFETFNDEGDNKETISDIFDV